MMLKKALLLLFILLISAEAYSQEDVRGGILDKNVNGNDEDYASYPIYGDMTDTLFFTSSRPVPNRRPIAMAAEIFYSIRPAADRLTKKINVGWSPAKQIVTSDSKLAEYTRGSQAVHEDRIIFAAERDLSTATASGTSYLFDLWQMTKRSDGYSLPEPLTEVNDIDAWDSQPALSQDGKTLYFVSNRAGGKGGLDIWYSVRNSFGKWSAPLLVPNINTSGNEVSPHVGSDGKFYFSSDWDFKANELGKTAKDIYRCDFKDALGAKVPANPVKLDEAFRKDAEMYGVKIPEDINYNSDADDEFPFISPDRRFIFLTSNRGADYDKRNIYAFSLPKSKIMLVVNVSEQILDENGMIISPATPKVGLPLSLHDVASGNSIEITSGTPYEIDADRDYQVRFSKFVEDECYQNKIEGPNELKLFAKRPYGPDTLYIRDALISRKKIDIPPIVFHSTDTLPYFVTGYWYPNTSKNINIFRQREAAGFFNETGFVDSTGYNYDGISHKIDSIFNARIYSPLEKLLPIFQDFCRDTLYLKVTIHGYTDPRSLSAGNEHPYRPQSRYKRIYNDETVTVGLDERGEPVDISKGIDMYKKSWPKDENDKNDKWIKLPDEGEEGNVLLSKLRAHHTFVTFDRDMRELSPIYAQLRDNGRVILDAEGYGIDKKGYKERGLRDDPQSRRIEIYLDVLRPGELEWHKRLQGGGVAKSKFVTRSVPDVNIDDPGNALITDQVETVDEINIEDETEEAYDDDSEEIDVAETVNEPLPPTEVEEKEVKVAKSLCYVIRYKTYDSKAEAEAGLKTLQEFNVEEARIAEYFDPFGGMSYRLISGCYYTAGDAIKEVDKLRDVSKALGLQGKPDIVR